VLLDGSFRTSPNGNPGNAVFAYLTAGAIDPAGFDIALFGTGTPKGQQLCLGDITVPAGETLLAAVHMGIDKDKSPSTLPADGTFDFSAEVYPQGSNCTGSLHAAVTPNPAAVQLGYVLK
jgi:hypothetical protein